VIQFRFSKAVNRVSFFDISTFLTAIIISRFLSHDFGSFIEFSVFVAIASKYFHSESFLQKISLATVFPIIISPFYLVIRGAFTQTPLTSFDLSIYLFVFLITLISLNPKVRISTKHFYESNLKNLIFAATSFILLAFLSIYLKSKSIADSVSWVMSGDSRGHLVFANDIAKSGWIDPATFLLQPISAPAFLSLLLDQTKLSETNISDLLTSQLQTYSFAWILFIGLLGFITAACGELIWKSVSKTSNNVPIWVVCLSSMSSLFSSIIGPATYDGFFTAVLSIGTILILVNWLLEISSITEVSYSPLITGTLLFFGSLMSWMFVAMFTAPLLISGFWIIVLKKNSKNKVKLIIGFLLAISIALFFMHNSSYVQHLIHESKVALSVSGAINATNPTFYYLLIFAILLVGLLNIFTNRNIASTLIMVAIINAASLIIFKSYSNLGINSWNYYLLKYQWIVASTMFLMLAVFIYVQVARYFNIHEVFQKSRVSFVIIAVTFICIVLISEHSNPTKNLWVKALKGWENPRSSVVDRVLSTNFDSKNPTLFFHHGYDGDSRLGNFWFTSFLTQQEPIRGWNYTIDTLGEVSQMCDVNSYYGKVNLITYDAELPNLLFNACPEEEFSIQIDSQLN
jgi:hypothetical protein